jgi:hypothetical protein
LKSPKEGFDKSINENDINLVALNPISGFRTDKNVTAFRSFLIEMDEGDLLEQKKYIESLNMPYSICTFSGNKSLHYGIVLDDDLPSEKFWKFINQWILNIVTKADQQTKNPSRSIRFPGNIRNDGQGLEQKLVEINGRVCRGALYVWLNKFPDKKPKQEQKLVRTTIPDLSNVPPYIYDLLNALREGTQTERNKTWFHIACVIGTRVSSVDELQSFVDKFFVEEDDFKENEWKTCLKSGYWTAWNG